MFIQCLPYLLDWWLRFYLATISAKKKAASKGKAKVPCVHDKPSFTKVPCVHDKPSFTKVPCVHDKPSFTKEGCVSWTQGFNFFVLICF